jgi:hypothetical protein
MEDERAATAGRADDPTSLQLPNLNGAGIGAGAGRNAHARQSEQSYESGTKS